MYNLKYGLSLLVLCVISAPVILGIGEKLQRSGQEIVACGQFFDIGTPVVLWMDPGGYDAYRTELRSDKFSFIITKPTKLIYFNFADFILGPIRHLRTTRVHRGVHTRTVQKRQRDSILFEREKLQTLKYPLSEAEAGLLII